MKNRNNILLFVVCFFFFQSNLIAQNYKGYLFRCYRAETLDWSKLTHYDLFFSFLDEKDLKIENVDSINFKRGIEIDHFPNYFSNLFGSRLKVIETTPYKKEIINNNCKLERVISLKDMTLYDLIYVFKSDNDPLYKIILINKVELDYCVLKKVESESYFSERISLKNYPCFRSLSMEEKEILVDRFKQLKNINGKILLGK